MPRAWITALHDSHIRKWANVMVRTLRTAIRARATPGLHHIEKDLMTTLKKRGLNKNTKDICWSISLQAKAPWPALKCHTTLPTMSHKIGGPMQATR
mmetsp:Transcript_13057/g.36880  ORF Transcript_13057/g.36880 Transcript_13057/m.36880 type:complete len:97 (-) Transcript_13057:435-725(-)